MKTNQSNPGIVLRGELAELFGQQYGGDRDISEVLGYDTEITANQFRARYRRDDIARRIVELPPEDTWKYRPIISDGDHDEPSDFERDIETLEKDHRLFHYYKRADIASGIGEYGLLFIGFSDGQDLSTPVNDGVLSEPDDIAYMTPFSQDLIEDWTLGKETDEIDETDRMYNRPVEYRIDFSDIDGDPSDEDLKDVHHSRVIHIAEDLVESDLKGTPRLRPIWDRLTDRQKVVGASAEMFYTGADRKFHFNIDSENAADIPDDQLENLDEEVQKLVHDMQHYIKTFNTDLEVLSGEEIDPSGVHDVLMKSISAATGIPKRILEGSERGELASSQDRANWFGTIHTRQNTFAEHAIVRPIVDKFIEYGIVSPPEEDTYDVKWENLFELNELEQAEAMNTRAQALERVAPGGNTDLIASTEQLLDFVVNNEMIDFDDVDDDLPDVDANEMKAQWENYEAQ